jgi:proline-specific peptidase
MPHIDRRQLTAALLTLPAAASLPTRALAAAPAYPPLPPPDPKLWHIDTAPTTDGFADGPGGKLYHRVYGKAGRTPLIALHGGPAAGELYMRPYAGLAADRQVVLYDQGGCGRSARMADLSRYTLDYYVAELDALRRHLGFDKIVLLGHSWGGILAPAYAAAHPDHVAALVIAGSAPRWADFTEAGALWLKEMGPAAEALVAKADAGQLAADDPAYGAFMQAYYSRHLCRLDPWPDFLNQAGEALAHNPLYAYLNGPSEFQFTGAFAGLDVSAQLRSLRIPILVTCGEYDEGPPAVAAKIVALAPRAKLHAFSGLSHMSHIEDPARVTGVTGAFLRSL